MTQQTSFLDRENLARGRRAAADGIEKVEKNNKHFTYNCRAWALTYAKTLGTVTSDDVRQWCCLHNLTPTHPNAWGAIFRTKQLKWNGKMVASTRPSNHGRLIKIWVLR